MKNYVLILLPILLFSCQKQVKSTSGSIDVFTNVYFDASRGLDNYRQFYISKMDYRNDTIIEFIPNIEIPSLIERVTVIKNDSFATPIAYEEAGTIPISKILEGKKHSVFKKPFGSQWVNIPIYEYDKRIKMNDTVLYNKEFHRFKTVQGRVLSIFYIKKTDTILPYSLNRVADKDYKGRLERIDSYDKNRDIFTTIVMKPHDKISDDGQTLFSFNSLYNKMTVNKKE